MIIFSIVLKVVEKTIPLPQARRVCHDSEPARLPMPHWLALIRLRCDDRARAGDGSASPSVLPLPWGHPHRTAGDVGRCVPYRGDLCARAMDEKRHFRYYSNSNVSKKVSFPMW